MRLNSTLIILIFLSCSLFSFSQLSIDVYSGYNHSKRIDTLPNDYYYSCSKGYFTGNILDTVQLGDSTFYVFEQKGLYWDEGRSYHEFTPKSVLGINLQYTYLKFFKTGISFEKHGVSNSESYFNIDTYVYLYSHENMSIDSLIISTEKDVISEYDIYCISIFQSFLFPYKKFTFSTDFSLITNYFTLNYQENIENVSLNHYYLNNSPASTSILNYEVLYQGKSLGFRIGLGISYQVYNNISAFGKVGYTWANLEFQNWQQTYKYYYHSDDTGYLRTYTESDPKELNSEDIPFEKINYNSWNFRVGLRYTFNKTKKK
jgi:hypothetical protein